MSEKTKKEPVKSPPSPQWVTESVDPSKKKGRK